MTQDVNSPFAVVGATGQQGRAVIDALLERRAAVRAVVRDPSSDKSIALADRGVSLVVADQDDPDSMTAAFSDVAGLFLMTTFDEASGGTEGETRRGRSMAESAASAGTPHVVYSSVGGAERESGVPHFESKRRVEERLTELVPVSFVRPTFFLENLAGSLGSGGDGSGGDGSGGDGSGGDSEVVVRFPMPSDVPLQMVSVRDIGVVSALALLDPSLLPGGSLEIAGDELDGDHIASTIGEVLGRPARFEALPLSAIEGDSDLTAMFRWFVETPAYQADLGETRRIDPDVLDLRAWVARAVASR